MDTQFNYSHPFFVKMGSVIPQLNHANEDRFMSFFDRTLARLSEVPGVTAAGATNMIPLDGNGTDRLIEVEGYIPRDDSDMPDAQNRQATPGWFAAMGIPLVSGRRSTRCEITRSASIHTHTYGAVRRDCAGALVHRYLRRHGL